MRILLSNLHKVLPNLVKEGEFAVTTNSSSAQIKKAYLKAILVVHPDKQMDALLIDKVRTSLVFTVLQEAYKRYQSDINIKPSSN